MSFGRLTVVVNYVGQKKINNFVEFLLINSYLAVQIYRFFLHIAARSDKIGCLFLGCLCIENGLKNS
jgi:hypothetical protein